MVRELLSTVSWIVCANSHTGIVDKSYIFKKPIKNLKYCQKKMTLEMKTYSYLHISIQIGIQHYVLL